MASSKHDWKIVDWDLKLQISILEANYQRNKNEKSFVNKSQVNRLLIHINRLLVFTLHMAEK